MDFAGVAALVTALTAVVASAIASRARMNRLRQTVELQLKTKEGDKVHRLLGKVALVHAARIAAVERIGGYTTPLFLCIFSLLGAIALAISAPRLSFGLMMIGWNANSSGGLVTGAFAILGILGALMGILTIVQIVRLFGQTTKEISEAEREPNSQHVSTPANPSPGK